MRMELTRLTVWLVRAAVLVLVLVLVPMVVLLLVLLVYRCIATIIQVSKSVDLVR